MHFLIFPLTLNRIFISFSNLLSSEISLEVKNEYMDTPNNSNEIKSQPVTPNLTNNKIMAILAYIGPLVIVSYLTAKDDPFVKFHIRQGLVLVVIEIATWFLSMVFWPIWPLLQLINLAVLILAIVGIVRAYEGKEIPLPVVGDWSKYFKI